MQLAILFDPADLLDIRRAMDHLTTLADRLEGTVPENRAAVREILGLASGELVRLAHQHFGTDRFSLVTLAERTGREVPSLHSLAANLGRACAQRHVQVFDRHGGQPMELSIHPDVARVLAEAAP